MKPPKKAPMSEKESRREWFKALLTVTFLYGISALFVIFCYSRDMSGVHGELSTRNILFSAAFIVLSLTASFFSGFGRQKSVLYGYITAVSLNLLIRPVYYFSAPLMAVLDTLNQKTGAPRLGLAVAYIVMMFLIYAAGIIIAKKKNTKKEN